MKVESMRWRRNLCEADVRRRRLNGRRGGSSRRVARDAPRRAIKRWGGRQRRLAEDRDPNRYAPTAAAKIRHRPRRRARPAPADPIAVLEIDHGETNGHPPRADSTRRRPGYIALVTALERRTASRGIEREPPSSG
ncbi:hypothetical protein EVAR_77358_1 [Eumeta japonica]|uniref:Uncharacterized protein n=1 Tax=Eumeta variegata TaxID=151549 RepID=A0A4C1UX34_EUMVA|nr:hypothetical protein EVAR_77358_1 [Eumeta japonica]